MQSSSNQVPAIAENVGSVKDIIENNFPYKIAHQKLNDFVKIVCKMAGIVEVVKGNKLNTEI